MPGLRVDLIVRKGMGTVEPRAGSGRGVNLEPTRLSLGRDAANRRQRPVEWVDTEPGQVLEVRSDP